MVTKESIPNLFVQALPELVVAMLRKIQSANSTGLAYRSRLVPLDDCRFTTVSPTELRNEHGDCACACAFPNTAVSSF
jgi:hypothetical protein